MSQQLAKLVAVSKPLIEGVSNAEEFIAYAARVSNPSNQINNETAPKLLKYLVKHSHWSPLEMVSCTMEINTTRDIARQVLRHRSFSFQEFSQRYADASQLGWSVREARLQDVKNRQNSIETDDKELSCKWEEDQILLMKSCLQVYEEALERGIAKEVARAVLPEGLINSKLYMAGTLRSWVHYCDLRRANGTQKEHMELAEACWVELLKEFPILKELEEVMDG